MPSIYSVFGFFMTDDRSDVSCAKQVVKLLTMGVFISRKAEAELKK